MSTITQSPLNLSYDLLPPLTEQEVRAHGAAMQQMPPAPAPGAQLAEENLPQGRVWRHPTPGQTRALMAVWTVMAMGLAFNGNNATLAGELLPYNIFAYFIIRWAQRPRTVSIIASALVGFIFFMGVSTGINSAVLVMTLLLTLFISSQQVGAQRFPQRAPMGTPHWAQAPGTPKASAMADIPTSLKRVWGFAGMHIGSNTTFGEAAQIGAKGEKIVGEALNMWASRNEHVRVFHGLCFTPGKTGADVDHAVLINNRLILVDSKYWGYGNYSWGAGEKGPMVLKDGAPFAGSNVHMDAAVKKWYIHMPEGVVVESRIVAVNDGKRSNGYSISNAGAPQGVALTSLDNLIKELDIIVRNGNQRFLNRYAVKAIVSELQ